MKHIKIKPKRETGGFVSHCYPFYTFQFLSSSAGARDLRREKKDFGSAKSFKPSALLPNTQQRVHRVGLLNTLHDQLGIFWKPGKRTNESKGGCFNPNPDREVQLPPVNILPDRASIICFKEDYGSGLKWMINRMSSLACDGWFGVYEMWPDGPAPKVLLRKEAPVPLPPVIHRMLSLNKTSLQSTLIPV